MIEVIVDELSSGHVIRLLQEHRSDMLQHSPAESVHALDAAALHSPDLTFWSAWVDNARFAGCGALRQIADDHGEIKSMRTSRQFLPRGVAASILDTIINTAIERNYQRLSLETGSMQVFIPARKLYQRYGFTECPPFAQYVEDPASICMTLAL